MLYSPGTKRRCAKAVPEEAQLKLALLGLIAVYQYEPWGFGVYQYPRSTFDSRPLLVVDDDSDWTQELTALANMVCKNKLPNGWGKTTQVDRIAVLAASVIDEENFNEQ
jgi:hypothetical protein